MAASKRRANAGRFMRNDNVEYGFQQAWGPHAV
jgi:hypothetical protein